MIQAYLQAIKSKWIATNTLTINPASSPSLDKFEHQYGVLLPDDLRDYFTTLNGTGGDYEEEFFRFNALPQFLSLPQELASWHATAPFQQLLMSLPVPEQVFIFADYSFFLFAYAIRLHPTTRKDNEVYILSGSGYQVVSTCFTDFLALYLRDDTELYFADR